ncbi:protein RALF-like 4 [Mercurialis annua]|uniref:protein RALF-like 4 n=1 Tax=Mercurialis annua TaxID=3986 RepID=UPI00215FD503|nr:protein RALF-like 4 [Mercurialis annua]
MNLRFWLVFLLITIAMVVRDATATSGGKNYSGGLVGDQVGEEDEMLMESEASRRILASGKRFLSYAALKANMTPCNKRGRSYYSCKQQSRRKVNPYKRACTVITKCYRFTH